MSVAAFPSSRPGTEAIRFDLAPHALALVMFAICAFSPNVLNDGDTWSHIATGEWILAHRAAPHVDPFTFTFAGQPWTAHEWLSEVLFALAHRTAGFRGVCLLTGFAAASAMFLLVRRVARDLGGPALATIGALALMLIAPSLLARPHILALPLLALWASALFDAREAGRTPPLRIAALMTLWANLHGGFAFGLALIVPFALEAMLCASPAQRFATARSWAIFAAVAIVAAAITPFGVEGLLFPVRLLGLHALAQIGEWGPESFAKPNALEVALLGLVALAIWKPVRVAPIRIVLLIGLFYLSLSHARHEMLLAVVAPMILARPIAQALDAPAEPPRFAAHAGAAGLLAACLVVSVVRAFLPAPVTPAYASTEAALAALPADTAARPGLNAYSFGGFLIFDGRKPYIDGRADLFGDAFLADYSRIASGRRADLEAVLTKYGIGWTMFAPGQGAVETMDAEPGWRRVYADRNVVLHARGG